MIAVKAVLLFLSKNIFSQYNSLMATSSNMFRSVKEAPITFNSVYDIVISQ